MIAKKFLDIHDDMTQKQTNWGLAFFLLSLQNTMKRMMSQQQKIKDKTLIFNNKKTLTELHLIVKIKIKIQNQTHVFFLNLFIPIGL